MMEYILIKSGKERTAIALNTVRSIRKADFADSGTCRIFVERDTGDFNRFLPDDFCIAEMSALELTKWLKGEQEEKKENPLTIEELEGLEALEGLDKALEKAGSDFRFSSLIESKKQIGKDNE